MAAASRNWGRSRTMISNCSRACSARPASSSSRPSLYRKSCKLGPRPIAAWYCTMAVGREAVPLLPAELPRPAQRVVGFVLAPELVEHDSLMDQRLDVVRIQAERLVELGQRLVGLVRERVGEAEQLVRIGER